MNALRTGLSWAKYPGILGLTMIIFALFQGSGVGAAKGVLVVVLAGVPAFLLGAAWDYLKGERNE